MTDYEYILTQVKKYHFTKWDDEELRKCVEDKHGGNVALCRKELRERYMVGVDQELIAEAFKQSGQKDQQWVESQKKKVTDERQENK